MLGKQSGVTDEHQTGHSMPGATCQGQATAAAVASTGTQRLNCQGRPHPTLPSAVLLCCPVQLLQHLPLPCAVLPAQQSCRNNFALLTLLLPQVPPALKLAPGGVLLQEGSSKPAVLRGLNWFGWSVGSFNFDGMWVSTQGTLGHCCRQRLHLHRSGPLWELCHSSGQLRALHDASSQHSSKPIRVKVAAGRSWGGRVAAAAAPLKPVFTLHQSGHRCSH